MIILVMAIKIQAAHALGGRRGSCGRLLSLCGIQLSVDYRLLTPGHSPADQRQIQCTKRCRLSVQWSISTMFRFFAAMQRTSSLGQTFAPLRYLPPRPRPGYSAQRLISSSIASTSSQHPSSEISHPLIVAICSKERCQMLHMYLSPLCRRVVGCSQSCKELGRLGERAILLCLATASCQLRMVILSNILFSPN